MLQKIISGGQTGADRAALDFAIEFDIPHGGWIPNRIKQGKNTLRWDKTSCRRFEANEARLKLGVIAYNFLHMLRKFHVGGEGVRRSIEWLIRRLIKVGATVSYHARRWHVHVSSAFPLDRHFRAAFDTG